jgi:hypothetical protein
MPINYDLTRCVDKQKLLEDTPDGWPVTEIVILLMPRLGVREITDNTAERLWHRIHAMETVTGVINVSGRPMRPQDIVDRIGLHTNATPKTDREFHRDILATLKERSDDLWERQVGKV